MKKNFYISWCYHNLLYLLSYLHSSWYPGENLLSQKTIISPKIEYKSRKLTASNLREVQNRKDGKSEFWQTERENSLSVPEVANDGDAFSVHTHKLCEEQVPLEITQEITAADGSVKSSGDILRKQ